MLPEQTMSERAPGTPDHARALTRESDQNDLEAYVRQLQEENKAFADAVRRGRKTSVKAEVPPSRRPFRNSTTTPALEAADNDLAAATIAANNTHQPGSGFTLEYYAQQIAERALTRNGRELKAKATTGVYSYHQLCYSSTYTRLAREILRQTMEATWPRMADLMGEEAGHRERTGFAGDCGEVWEKLRRALGLR